MEFTLWAMKRCGSRVQSASEEERERKKEGGLGLDGQMLGAVTCFSVPSHFSR